MIWRDAAGSDAVLVRVAVGAVGGVCDAPAPRGSARSDAAVPIPGRCDGRHTTVNGVNRPAGPPPVYPLYRPASPAPAALLVWCVVLRERSETARSAPLRSHANTKKERAREPQSRGERESAENPPPARRLPLRIYKFTAMIVAI